MPNLPPKHRLARISPTQQRREVDTRRGSARERGYTARWDQASRAYRSRNLLCVGCDARGRVEPATITDHIVPHKGDQRLFWDEGNWQACCQRCHDKVKARLEVMWMRNEIGASSLRLTSRKAIEVASAVYGEAKA